MFKPLPTLMFAVAIAATPHAHADTLDPGFAGSGVQVFTAAGEHTRVIGACPHADGSASVVAFRDTPREWVVTRLSPNGTLDTSYSGDGMVQLAHGAPVLDWPMAVSCIGAGNADPNDDAVLIAATTSVTYVQQAHLLTSRIDLNLGALVAQSVTDLNGLMMGYDPETGESDWRGLIVNGLFPGANGEYLVMGSVTQGETVHVGFVARLNANGGLITAQPVPDHGGVKTLEVYAARMIDTNELRALARVETASGRTWGLLRLAPTTLQLSEIVANGGPQSMGYALFKGRFIANGGFIVPALAPTLAPMGTTPHLLIVRGNQVADVTLPQPSLLAGETTGSSGAMSATVASAGRVIVGMGLGSAALPAVGYYTAMVKLGDGASVPDMVDADYGQLGSDVFRYAPPPAQSLCPGNTAPTQHFANLSSWGSATILVGNAAPRCYDEANNDFGTSTWMLAARIQSDVSVVFRDSFE